MIFIDQDAGRERAKIYLRSQRTKERIILHRLYKAVRDFANDACLVPQPKGANFVIDTLRNETSIHDYCTHFILLLQHPLFPSHLGLMLDAM